MLADKVPRSRLKKAVDAGKKRSEWERERKHLQMGYCSWCLSNGHGGELSGDADPDVQELMQAVREFTTRHQMMQFAFRRYIEHELGESPDDAMDFINEAVEAMLRIRKERGDKD